MVQSTVQRVKESEFNDMSVPDTLCRCAPLFVTIGLGTFADNTGLQAVLASYADLAMLVERGYSSWESLVFIRVYPKRRVAISSKDRERPELQIVLM
jgi:hypothetical protein